MAEDLDELEEEYPRRRPWSWVLVVIFVLATAVAGFGWKQSRDQQALLQQEILKVQREAEAFRSQAVEAKRQAEALEKKVALLTEERRELVQKVVELQQKRTSKPKAAEAAAKAPSRAKVPPPSAKKR